MKKSEIVILILTITIIGIFSIQETYAQEEVAKQTSIFLIILSRIMPFAIGIGSFYAIYYGCNFLMKKILKKSELEMKYKLVSLGIGIIVSFWLFFFLDWRWIEWA